MNLRTIQTALTALSKTYHEHIPLGDIFEVCTSNGVQPVDEDGENWSGMLCGKEGRASIDLRNIDTGKNLPHKCLQLQWYRMPSERFELNAYIG